MLFNSLVFGIFLAIALVLFWSSRRGAQVIILVGLSYYFYMYHYPRYFFLLATLTIFNYIMGLQIARRPRFARHLLVCAISVDLLSIGFYKYARFAVQTLESVLQYYGVVAYLSLPRIILPLGISFFTFQMMSYIVDTYRGGEPEKSFWNFAAYISFFPQLVAGPIVRPKTLLPQIRGERIYVKERAIRGIFLITQGLIKKIAFADFLGVYVNNVFNTPGHYSSLATLVAVYAFAFQIYFDFSGYTDIAIGCGKLFGFELPINFNLPYISRSPREFWRRWHISLSTWLRDYLYIPLGGNRKTIGRTYFNIMATMVLGGLWHGANWTFVLWGFYHGILISVQRFLEERFEFAKKLFSPDSKWLSILSCVLTFHLVCLGWVLFRAEYLAKASKLLRNIFVAGLEGQSVQASVVIMLAIAALTHVARSKWNVEDWFIKLPVQIQALGYACATIIIFLFFTEEKQFIYFQF